MRAVTMRFPRYAITDNRRDTSHNSIANSKSAYHFRPNRRILHAAANL